MSWFADETQARFVYSERLSDVFPRGEMTEKRSVIDVIGRTVLFHPDRWRLSGGDERDFARGNNDVIRFAAKNLVDAFIGLLGRVKV